MLTGRPARRAVGGLLVLITAAAGPVLATGQPALADSVRSAQQWVLDAVNAPAAWPVTQGSNVTVAVIDSGVQPDVSDLSGSVTSGPDLSGIGTPASDANWGMHGTWMASLIAGHGHGPGGSDGISGVAPQAKILSLRVLPDKKDPGYSHYKHESSSRGQHALARAIRYAVAHHASVISMSLGYGASSRVVRAALQAATRHGVVVVASSGNSGNSGSSASDHGKAHAPYSFPADYPGVLGVAAVGRSGSPAPFSSDNLSVQIAAPGVKVPAQGSDGQYWLVSGTSPACALTAGVAALIKSRYPHLAPALVIRAITISAQNQPKHGYDDRIGFGTLDAAVALTTAGKLTSFGVTGRGIGAGSHFGGGPKAVPPAPVGPRGSGQLLLFGGLGVACLILSLVAAGRLLLYRRRRNQAQQAAPPPGPSYPPPAPPAPARPAPAYRAAQPPAALATAWWGQDNGTRSPGPARAASRDQPDRTVAGPQPSWPPQASQPEPPRTEPHPSPSSPPPVPPSNWPGPSRRAEAPPSPAGSVAAAAPPPAGAMGAPSPGGASPSGTIPDWLASTQPPAPPAQVPWPDDDDAETTSPSGIPSVRDEPGAGPPPASPPPASPPPAWPPPAGATSSAWPAPDGLPSTGPASAGQEPSAWSASADSPSASSPSAGSPSAGATSSARPPLAGSLPASPPPSAWPSPDGSPSAGSPPASAPSAGALPSAWPAAAGSPPAGPASAGPLPSAWPASADSPSASSPSAGVTSSAWPPPDGSPSAGSPPASAPSAGALPSAWPAAAGSPSAGPASAGPLPSAWPASAGSTSASSLPAGSPPAGAAASAWPSPAGPPPSAPGPVRPGSASAGSAGPSRYLHGLGRPSPSGRHAARRDHPQPAPAWARNRPPGRQDTDEEEPDPRDEP